MSRRNERYKLVATFHASAAATTTAVGFIKPELDNRNSSDPATIYEPYIYLLVALVIVALGIAWLGNYEENGS